MPLERTVISTRIAAVTMTVCAIGVFCFAILLAVAAGREDADRVLRDYTHDPWSWLWMFLPSAAMAGLAAAVRRRLMASLFVLCVSATTLFLAVVDLYGQLQPLPPGANEFARGLGPHLAPLGQWMVVVMMAVIVAVAHRFHSSGGHGPATAKSPPRR
jgi:hypothetical protein